MGKSSSTWSWQPVIAWLIGFGVLFGGLAYWAVGTPNYALYRIGRSVAEHDLATFRQFVDTKAVTNNAVDALMDDANELVWGNAPADSWQAFGRQLSGAVMDLLRPKLHALAEAAVEQRLTSEFLKLDRPQVAPPLLALVEVEQDGRVATVKLQVEGIAKPVRIVLEQGPDRRWRVVVVDQALLKQFILQERQSQTSQG